MNCIQAKPLIHPYADGELDAAAILELEKHLQDCSACALEWRNLQALKKQLKHDALFFAAPNELRQHIAADLRAQLGDEPQQKFWTWNWLPPAMVSAVTACLAFMLMITFTHPAAQEQFAQEVVSSHIRSLMANHVLDVISTDQHTVKPWFNGKLDFSPPVKDLAAQGFPLTGGRLDYIGGRAVAALVFQRHKHVINLFVWPTKDSDSKPGAIPPIQGYNMVHWSQGQMDLWAVSDLNGTELMEFAQAFGN